LGAATGAATAFLGAATAASTEGAEADLAGEVLVLVTGVFEAGAAVGLAGFAAGAAAVFCEDLDTASAVFAGAALLGDLAEVPGAATGRAPWSATMPARARPASEGEENGDDLPPARALSGWPKPARIL